MGENIEIKARVRDAVRLRKLVEALSNAAPVVLEQEDIFFRVPRGRLKLRLLKTGEGELIYYERADESGPTQSNYWKVPTNAPQALRATLAVALGTLGVVRKKRHSYALGETRIHLDEVEGLGSFVEIEVPVREGQRAEAERIARGLMEKLGIRDKDLMSCSYIDLLAEEAA